jgi:hypothetical protein
LKSSAIVDTAASPAANDAFSINSTTQLPGMSTKMPPLRVSVNEGLASFVLPGISMDQILGSSHLKEEPRGW